MKDKLKKRLQCRDCDMPYCDISCNDLSDSNIDWIMELTNQRVIEELEEVLKSNMDIKQNTFISAINIANLKLANRIQQLKEN